MTTDIVIQRVEPDTHTLSVRTAREPAPRLWFRQVPPLALTSALALIAVAFAMNGARDATRWATPLFWVGVVALFLPVAWRAASDRAGHGERIALVAMLGLGLFLLEVLVAPLGFRSHDEFGHLRGTENILQTGHLFGHNPIVAIYSSFPGLEIVTSALAQLTGLSVFTVGSVLLGALRLIAVLALFGLLDEATGSPRRAAIGTLIYFGGPTFVFFDAHFAYESFALPVGLLLMQRAARAPREGLRAAPLAATLLLVVPLVAGHHLTAYLTAGFVLALGALHVAWRQRHGRPAPVLIIALTAGLAAVAWSVFLATPIGSYLWPVLNGAVSSAADLVAGSGEAGKHVFQSDAGHAAPLLEQILGFGSVALVLLGLPVALWRLARSRCLARPLPLLLALIAATYPLTLALRLTAAGTETSNRASAFVFIGIAYALPAGLAGIRLPKLAKAPGAGIALVTTLLLVGGIIVGTSPVTRLPGPYLPAETERVSGDPQSLAAARWAGRMLPAHGRLLSDLSNRLLLSSYGDLDAVCCYIGDRLIPRAIVDPTFDRQARVAIGLAHLRWIAVDFRLRRPSPSTHRFSERSDGGPYRHPLPRRALTKFDHVPGISRVFDNGAIRVYGTSHLPPTKLP